jgi:hypothetical protein
MLVGQRLSPLLLDRYMTSGQRMVKQQQTGQPDDGKDNLYAPMPGPGSAVGDFGEKSKTTSLYTRHLELSPNRKRAALVVAALAAGAAVRKLAP